MANPASVFCTCMGGVNKIKENKEGQYGVCKIGGKEYDEWEYFRTMNPS
jgi:putative hemolysin